VEITQVKGSGPYRRREKKLFRSGAESGVEISSLWFNTCRNRERRLIRLGAESSVEISSPWFITCRRTERRLLRIRGQAQRWDLQPMVHHLQENREEITQVKGSGPAMRSPAHGSPPVGEQRGDYAG
jgi:hypothetical protein